MDDFLETLMRGMSYTVCVLIAIALLGYVVIILIYLPHVIIIVVAVFVVIYIIGVVTRS